MSKYRTITKYIKAKFWENGEMTLSFKYTEHIAKALMEAPYGTYISIKESKDNPDEWSMYYKKPEGSHQDGQAEVMPDYGYMGEYDTPF